MQRTMSAVPRSWFKKCSNSNIKGGLKVANWLQQQLPAEPGARARRTPLSPHGSCDENICLSLAAARSYMALSSIGSRFRTPHQAVRYLAERVLWQ
jgi:hypothetical protein